MVRACPKCGQAMERVCSGCGYVRPGRPPRADARHRTLRVRLTADEYALVERLAAAAGSEIADYVRGVLLVRAAVILDGGLPD